MEWAVVYERGRARQLASGSPNIQRLIGQFTARILSTTSAPHIDDSRTQTPSDAERREEEEGEEKEEGRRETSKRKHKEMLKPTIRNEGRNVGKKKGENEGKKQRRK